MREERDGWEWEGRAVMGRERWGEKREGVRGRREREREE